MKTEWIFFKQEAKQSRLYQTILLMFLLFFLFRYYKIYGSGYEIMPWVFNLAVQQNFGQAILKNIMPIMYFIVALLLPMNHFSDYLVNARFLSAIRQQKNFLRYIYFLIFSFCYSIIYTLLVVIVVKLFSYNGSMSGMLSQLVMLETLTMISMIFSLKEQKIIGDIVSIIIVILYAGIPAIANYFKHLFSGQIVLMILVVAIGIISNQLYLKREIY